MEIVPVSANGDAVLTDLGHQFNKNIRPLLDAVDKLRNLRVTNEGIQLPSIVVVGDQSSGKSSVLELLATISLPRGQGIATRVPLILRLQSCRSAEDTCITISYKEKKSTIFEEEIKSAVDAATIELAGTGKGVTDTPISLHIWKPNAPDLTMIDLPGITRVPVRGQPENIYEQISAMIRHYLKPKETVILNVLSATVDFSTCESIRMSQQEDIRGERTLAVVTKVDRAPEGVYEKVTSDDVNIGLGYICVRNRADEDESHEEAREKERQLFRTHPSLSQLKEGTVGISALAKHLTLIQAKIIRSSLPRLVQQIDKALAARRKDMDALPNDGDPTDVFFDTVDDMRGLMQEIMLNGNYESFHEENEMHFPAHMEEMLQKFSEQLNKALHNILTSSKTNEIVSRMTEMKGLALPNFLSPALMKSLVSEEVDKVGGFCTSLVGGTHDYAKLFAMTIIEKATGMYPNLQLAYKQVAGEVLTASYESCMTFVKRALRKEKSNVFTMNDYYMENVRKIRDQVQSLKSKIHEQNYGSIAIVGFLDPIDLQEIYSKSKEYEAAWDMKVCLAAYWKVVHKRMADEIPLELRFSIESHF